MEARAEVTGGGASGLELRDIATKAARVRLAFADGVPQRGRETAPAIVLVHDILQSHFAWTDVMPALSAAASRVVALDLPGAGDSEKPPASRFAYDFSAFAEVVVDVIAGLRLGRVVLVGHGLGAAIALACAAGHPSTVEKLVLVSPTVYGDGKTPLERLAKVPLFGPMAIKQFVGSSEFRRYFREYVYGDDMRTSDARVKEYFERFGAPAGREATFATLKGTSDRRPVVALVPRVRQETLVVTGRMDKLVPPPHTRRLVRELASARLIALDTGHSPAEEAPAAFVNAVMQFLEPNARKR